MKKNFTTACRAGGVALTTLLTAFIASAADTPAPPAGAAAPATAPAPAAPGEPGQQGGRGNRGNNNNNNLQRNNFGGINFDEKQRELLQEARQVNGDELRKLNEKLAEAQKEFVKAVVAEKYDATIVREKADTIGKIQAEILALNGKAFATVSPTLKPEQRDSLEGNSRIGLAIISPAGNFGGGVGGNFAAGPAGGQPGFGGGRGGGAGDFGGRGGGGEVGGRGQGRDFGAGEPGTPGLGGGRGGRGGGDAGGPGGNDRPTRRRGDNPVQ